MPHYEFACDCGHEEGRIWPMSQSDKILICSKCGKQMYRTYNFHTSKDRYSKPIVSDSLAISPEQIPEHRRLFPDIEVTPDGLPVFDEFHKHDNYLKKNGFRKKRQKLKPKGKRIV